MKESRRGLRKRLPDYIAQKLGLKLNKNRRYRLNEKQVEQLHDLDQWGIRRLFFDIETSPIIAYTWRTGWKIEVPYKNIIENWKIICISWKWEHEDKVHNLRWDKNRCDKKMVKEFIKVLNSADEICAHNGDRFDIRKLRTRAIFHRIPMRFEYRTFDTLKKARSAFLFESNRLNDIGDFLGVGEKLKHEGFDMWVKCMQGDEKALDDMVEYCDRDITLLNDIHCIMQNYVAHNTHVGAHNDSCKASCVNCGSVDVELVKNNFTRTGVLKRLMGCKDCGKEYEVSNRAWVQLLEYWSKQL